MASEGPERKSAEARKEILSRQIGEYAARGRRVETQNDFQAVLVHGQRVNHLLHLFIAVFTCGLWGVIWLLLVLTGGEKRELVRVDEWGNVSLSRL